MVNHTPKRITPSVIVVVLLMTVCTQWALRDIFLEDAYMHIRYAANALETGVWGCWNIGETPVSGESSPLWLALLLVLSQLGITPLVAAKSLGGIALFACFIDLIMLYNRKRTTTDRLSEFVFAASLFTLIPLLFYSISGMETVLFVYLTTRLTLTPSARWHAWIAIPLVLIRPEGALFVFVLTVTKWWRNWKMIALTGLPAFGVFVAYLVFHRLYFGDWLPNTYYAKADLPVSHAAAYGLRATALFLKDYYFVIACAALLLLSRRLDRIDVRFVALMATCVFIVLKVGGDNAAAFPHHRHFLPILGVVWVYAFLFVETVSKHVRFRMLTTVVLVVALSITHYASESGTEHSPFTHPKVRLKKIFHLPSVGVPSTPMPTPSFERILSTLPDGALVATGASGKAPARFLNLKFLDMLGLNDVHISRHGTRQYGQVDTKTDFDYVLRRQPAVISLPIASRHVEAGQVQIGQTHWRLLVDQILDDTRLYENYRLIPCSSSAVFAHTNILSYLSNDMQTSARQYDPGGDAEE